MRRVGAPASASVMGTAVSTLLIILSTEPQHVRFKLAVTAQMPQCPAERRPAKGSAAGASGLRRRSAAALGVGGALGVPLSVVELLSVPLGVGLGVGDGERVAGGSVAVGVAVGEPAAAGDGVAVSVSTALGVALGVALGDAVAEGGAS